MCNFSKGVLEKGFQIGKKEGLQQGVFGFISTLLEIKPKRFHYFQGR